jgi:hypothetical protein
MRMKLASALLAGLFLSVPGHAAVYKCPDGTFQDKPCDKGEGRVVTKRNTVGKPKPPDDACAALGLEAGQIAKAKAEGATSAKLLSDVDAQELPYARKLEQKKLIVDVFQKTGSPQEVAITFEAECVKSRDAQKAARPAPDTDARRMPGAAVGNAPQTDPAEEKKRAAEQRKRRCDDLKGQRDSVVAQQRSGGSVTTMDSLQAQRLAIDKKISAECN